MNLPDTWIRTKFGGKCRVWDSRLAHHSRGDVVLEPEPGEKLTNHERQHVPQFCPVLWKTQPTICSELPMILCGTCTLWLIPLLCNQLKCIFISTTKNSNQGNGTRSEIQEIAPQGNVKCELGHRTCLALKAVWTQVPSETGTLTVMTTVANQLFNCHLWLSRMKWSPWL